MGRLTVSKTTSQDLRVCMECIKEPCQNIDLTTKTGEPGVIRKKPGIFLRILERVFGSAQEGDLGRGQPY